MVVTRREYLGGMMAVASSRWHSDREDHIADLERRTGGRLGVAAIDLRHGRRVAYRGDERFPMCSTHKLLTVGATLARVDQNSERLDRIVRYGKDAVVAYSPVTGATDQITIEALCAAAMEESDNTAANLLLMQMGGPAGLNRYLRKLDDHVTRLDRLEPALNEGKPNDPRDTTTPHQMASDIGRLLAGRALTRDSRSRLRDWMVKCRTGDSRIRAGVPDHWIVGDKTGTNKDAGIANDVAVTWRTSRAQPIILAVFIQGATASAAEQDKVIAAVASLICH